MGGTCLAACSGGGGLHPFGEPESCDLRGLSLGRVGRTVPISFSLDIPSDSGIGTYAVFGRLGRGGGTESSTSTPRV